MESLPMSILWLLAAAAMTALLVNILTTSREKRQAFALPTVGADTSDINTLKERYFKNDIFQVITPDGPRVFLPRRLAEDLKPFSRHEASGMKALSDVSHRAAFYSRRINSPKDILQRHIGHYTTIDHESDIMLGAIKIDLNQWTPIELHEKLLRVVAQASARIFVGYPMCRNEEWLDCSTRFALDVMVGGEKLKQWHPWLRPVAQHFIPEMRRIRGDHQLALELLLPELQKRSQERENAGPAPHDMIEWMEQRAKKLGDTSFDSKEMANLQVLTATAAIFTTRLAIIHVLYDLAARPEYIEPLKEEIFEVTNQSGGVIRKQHLTQMRKLDSFMKESQRHNPPSIATFQRKAMIPIDLSNGFHISPGTVVQCNTNMLDEAPAEWGDPNAFDGFRFYKLRSKPEDANKFQYAGTSYNSMHFGYGNDACPGRFFASNQIKIILAHILTNYHFKFGDGVVGRPKNPMFEVNVLADPTVEVLFKKIQ
ncbi:hypothetical protein O1611_g2277 [Lasiodiplodia mahajangana]|uniref:Uncharacterized protein n=1 Tax=Lasiodiplodia mahajangana TaxID=1108764 RepID=A0ACC2JVK9_9PEZI|nr:hypothetical protein O1611_g2277 [Lasiodiplodia mahajangana]